MVYASKTTLDTAAMTRSIDFLQKAPAILSEVVLEVSARYEQSIIDDLGDVPGPVQYPIEWSSEKQRRAFFATNGFGGGIPHQRQGRPGMGWRVDISQRGGVVTLAVQNTWNAARYVFDNLLGISTGDQQPFHRNTGWQLAAPKVTRWFKTVNDEIYKRYRARIKEERRKK